MSEAAFQKAIQFVLPHEDAYARGHWGDPNFVVTENVDGDAGGLTKYGIDAAGNPGVDIANLTQDGAVAIYRARYWDAHNLDALPDKLAICAFDTYVNGGSPIAWLQQAEDDVLQGNCLVVDAQMGPATIAALNALSDDEISAVVTDFLRQRDARFERVAAAHANDRQFLAGWEQRDKDLAEFLLA